MSRSTAARARKRGQKAGAEPATERMDFRLDPAHKALIERAAAYRGETVSGYAVSTLVRDAERVIREHEMLMVTDRDRDRFLELLANAPEPAEAPRRAPPPGADLEFGIGFACPSRSSSSRARTIERRSTAASRR